MSTFHFENVAYATFLFFASGADAVPELDALFILTQSYYTRGETRNLTRDPPTTGLVPRLTVVTGLAWGRGSQSQLARDHSLLALTYLYTVAFEIDRSC